VVTDYLQTINQLDYVHLTGYTEFIYISSLLIYLLNFMLC